MPPPSNDPAASPLPPALAQSLRAAFARHGAGDLIEARRLYAAVLAAAPEQFDALHGLGVVAIQQGMLDEAEPLLRRATAANPRSAQAHSNHFAALQRLRRFDEALAACERALAVDPRYPEGLCNRGLALAALQRHDEAIASYDAALAQRPAFASAWYNRGLALAALSRHAEALASYDRAQAGSPPSAAAHYNRGVALAALGRNGEALASYDQALLIAPDLTVALNNRGGLLTEAKRYAEAAASYDRALALDPDFADARYNRGLARAHLGQHSGASEDFAHAARLDPQLAFVRGMALHARMHLGDWRDFDADRAAVVADARAGRCGADPLTMLALTDSCSDQLDCAATWTRTRCPPQPPLWHHRPRAEGRIRVAYLSADLREHAVAYLLADVFERHDRARFETLAVSYGPAAPSPMRARLEGAFDRFVDVREESDREVAQMLVDAQADIVVDLAGFTADARTGICALRPAPVQVNYLGFPGTLGAGYFDYILADRFVIPEARRAQYAEKVVHLPDTFQANGARHSLIGASPARAAAGLPEDGFVFCAFNSTWKIHPTLFVLWLRLLQRVPGSVLWLVGGDDTLAANLRRMAAQRGVDGARLVFAPRLPYAQHLARYALADLFLDTLPFNGGTTTSDALTAGLPVLTCSGDAFAARMAGSLLRTIGLPELCTDSLDDYAALALALAGDPPRLAALRARLARNRVTSPLFDADRFRRHLEAAYRTMVERHEAGLPPEHFAVGVEPGG